MVIYKKKKMKLVDMWTCGHVDHSGPSEMNSAFLFMAVRSQVDGGSRSKSAGRRGGQKDKVVPGCGVCSITVLLYCTVTCDGKSLKLPEQGSTTVFVRGPEFFWTDMLGARPSHFCPTTSLLFDSLTFLVCI